MQRRDDMKCEAVRLPTSQGEVVTATSIHGRGGQGAVVEGPTIIYISGKHGAWSMRGERMRYADIREREREKHGHD